MHELLIAELAAAGEDYVREQAPVAVARVLRRIADELDGAALRNAAREGGGLGRVALADLWRVDADQPHLLVAPGDLDVNGVAVHDVRHGAAQCERAGLSGLRRTCEGP